jgi:hypothetical protein
MDQNKKLRKTENRKEYMKEYNRLYYKNKLDKFREKVQCDCGLLVNKYGLSEHLKSTRHGLLIENIKLKSALDRKL